MNFSPPPLRNPKGGEGSGVGGMPHGNTLTGKRIDTCRLRASCAA